MGEVIVRDADSTWTNVDTLNVGSIGTGTLSIEGGGRVSNTNASVGVSQRRQRNSHGHRYWLNLDKQR